MNMLDQKLIEDIEQALREDPHAFTDVLGVLKDMAEVYIDFQNDQGDEELAGGFSRVHRVLDGAFSQVRRILGSK